MYSQINPKQKEMGSRKEKYFPGHPLTAGCMVDADSQNSSAYTMIL